MEFDKDLMARQEARQLAKAAEAAQKKLAEMSQQQLDAIAKAVAFLVETIDRRRRIIERICDSVSDSKFKVRYP